MCPQVSTRRGDAAGASSTVTLLVSLPVSSSRSHWLIFRNRKGWRTGHGAAEAATHLLPTGEHHRGPEPAKKREQTRDCSPQRRISCDWLLLVRQRGPTRPDLAQSEGVLPSRIRCAEKTAEAPTWRFPGQKHEIFGDLRRFFSVSTRKNRASPPPRGARGLVRGGALAGENSAGPCATGTRCGGSLRITCHFVAFMSRFIPLDGRRASREPPAGGDPRAPAWGRLGWPSPPEERLPVARRRAFLAIDRAER